MINLTIKRIAPKFEKIQKWTNDDGTQRCRKYKREWVLDEIHIDGIMKRNIRIIYELDKRKTTFLKRLTINRKLKDGYIIWRYAGQPDIYIKRDGFYVDKKIYEKHKRAVENAVYRAFSILSVCSFIEGIEQVNETSEDIKEDEDENKSNRLLRYFGFTN